MSTSLFPSSAAAAIARYAMANKPVVATPVKPAPLPFKPISFTVDDPRLGAARYAQGPFTDPKVRAGNIAMLRGIVQRRGALIQKWAGVFGLPAPLIVGKIAVESGAGDMNATRSGSQFKGIMQISAASFFEPWAKWMASVKTAIPAEAVALTRALVPEMLKVTSASPFTSAINAKIANALATNAEFNIMAGCLLIRWLAERTGGAFAKIVFGYAQGAYRSEIKPAAPADPVVLNKALGRTNPNYLVKLLGKDGFAALAFRENVLGDTPYFPTS